MGNPNLGSEMKRDGYSKEEGYFARIDAELITQGRRVAKPRPYQASEPVEPQNIFIRFLKRIFNSKSTQV
jgi:hypothetical protein